MLFFVVVVFFVFVLGGDWGARELLQFSGNLPVSLGVSEMEDVYCLW